MHKIKNIEICAHLTATFCCCTIVAGNSLPGFMPSGVGQEEKSYSGI